MSGSGGQPLPVGHEPQLDSQFEASPHRVGRAEPGDAGDHRGAQRRVRVTDLQRHGLRVRELLPYLFMLN